LGNWLAALPVVLIYAPTLPGLYWALLPAWDSSVWQGLWVDPQFARALCTTLLSSTLSSLLACLLAGAVATLVYPGPRWFKLQHHLAPLLSVPHAAFAVGVFFLLSPSGWLARCVALPLAWMNPPEWVTVQDPYALSLSLALAIKESWFLLWVLAAVLSESAVARHMHVARSLGYNSVQSWRQIVWPLLLPRLGWPLAAVFAYSLSVVDMALILGPGTPPTLAVLAWHWLTDPEPALQARGSAASLVLLALLLVCGGTVRWLWQRALQHPAYPSGLRLPLPRWHRFNLHTPLFLTGYAALAVLLLWSVADAWFFPSIWPEALTWHAWRQADWTPFWTTLWLATVANLICLPATLIWLEWGPRHLNAALYLPLILPTLPVVAGQYAALLHLGLDGTALAVVWSHLLWVLPYVVLTLVGVYRNVDPRLLTTARALGCSHMGACIRVKWPALVRPILAALAVGFAVSVAQYLPTLFAGGGRFATVTTEAVALSAGGNRRTLAVQALLQVALPLVVFALAAWLAAWAGKGRRRLL
jgi:putative thiamine transport system permease protein